MSKRLLFVDDDPSLLLAVSETLLAEGYQVTTARRGAEALVRIAEAVARGLSNKEIAAEFQLNLRTVEGHTSRVLAKKGFSNRVEIARYVLEQR